MSLWVFSSSAVTFFAFFSIGWYPEHFLLLICFILFFHKCLIFFLLCSFNYENSKTKSSSLLDRRHRVRFRDTYVSMSETFVRHSPTLTARQPYQLRPANCHRVKNRRPSGSYFIKLLTLTVFKKANHFIKRKTILPPLRKRRITFLGLFTLMGCS